LIEEYGEVLNMNDEKKVSLSFPCPNCLEPTAQLRGRIQLEKALEEGKIDLYHILCNHSWTQELEPHHKTNIADLIEREFPPESPT